MKHSLSLLVAERASRLGRVLLAAERASRLGLLWVVGLVSALLFFSSPARSAPGAGENLLFGLSPIRSQNVRLASVLTDDKAQATGDFWKTDRSAVFGGVDAFVVYDLGAVHDITAVWLQGDCNDRYELRGSTDGEHFESIWRSPVASGFGMQSRFTSNLSASARYLRVSPSEGDGAFSLSEVQVFERPASFPPGVSQFVGAPLERKFRDKTLIFGFVALLAVVLAYRKAPRWWLALLGAAVLWAGATWVVAQLDVGHIDNREVSLVRGTVALVAAVAVLRESFFPPRFAAHRGWTLGTLGVCGLIGFSCFYNLGHPQFWDNGKHERTFVHYLDLRQYYPTAKYFSELGYRGTYRADVAAYLEDEHKSISEIANLPMRNLSNLQVSSVANERPAIESIKASFSPERWEAYKKDAAYFRDAMGAPLYLETMIDMGGNATPVWMSLAHRMFSAMTASNDAFLWTALLDPILLFAAFIAIGRTFGLRTAFICMTIFGANDFIMYGTCWAGATLRHDWLAYLGLGAAALKSKRWALGGAFLAFSTSIRAFPMLSIVGVILPAFYWLVSEWRRTRKLPTLAVIRQEQGPLLRILAGAACAFVVLFAISATVISPVAWIDWASKVGQLSSDPHASHISLRSLIAGGGGDQGEVLRARMPVFVGAVLIYVAAVVAAARGKRPEQAAILALVLVPVLMYPANYYIHLVFLLPLLMQEKSVREALGALDGSVALTLLLLCAAQYGAALVTDRPLHFYLTTILLFAAITYLLVILLRDQAARAGWFAAAPDEKVGDVEGAKNVEGEVATEREAMP